jgi:hypothetical protein
VLESVDTPATWQFYLSKGYQRAVDHCTLTPGNNARARADYPAASERLQYGRHPDYRNGARGMYLAGYNYHYFVDGNPDKPKPDTLWMSKCVTTPRANAVGVRYDAPAKSAKMPGVTYGLFPRPQTRVVAVYGIVSGRPARIRDTGSLPDIFDTRRSLRSTTRSPPPAPVSPAMMVDRRRRKRSESATPNRGSPRARRVL